MLHIPSLLEEVSHDEAKMRERRETFSFLSFLPRRERPLLAGKHIPNSAEGNCLTEKENHTLSEKRHQINKFANYQNIKNNNNNK